MGCVCNYNVHPVYLCTLYTPSPCLLRSKVNDLCFSRQVRRLLSCSDNGNIGIWDLDIEREEVSRYMYMCTCVCVYMYMCTCIHVHVYMYTCTCTACTVGRASRLDCVICGFESRLSTAFSLEKVVPGLVLCCVALSLCPSKVKFQFH